MMPQTTPPPVGLCVQDLTVRYGTAAVLQGVSFSVPVSGQLIGLLGVNGSGKTTLLKAAAGLLPHTGQCLLDGVPLESLSTRRLAQTVSYIPQQSGISVSLSAREVVLMGFNPRLGVLQSPTAAMRAAADEALRTVGLADKAGQDYLTLSGGEKQLCILARTIAEDAPLLLLDEPDSALDLANRSRMTALLAQLVHPAARPRWSACTTPRWPWTAVIYWWYCRAAGSRRCCIPEPTRLPCCRQPLPPCTARWSCCPLPTAGADAVWPCCRCEVIP